MKTSRALALVVLLVSTTTFQMARAQDHPTTAEHPSTAEHPAKAEHPAQANDIVAVASGAGEFTTFIAAIEAAGLVEKFHGKGPFTVFAPTDAAFAKLPAGTMEDLLEPANKAKLAGMLACHVVPGKIMVADVKTMKATNVSGQDLAIKVEDGVVSVDDAKIVTADLVAANGIIHGIDAVLIPTTPGGMPTSEKPKDHPAH